MFRTLAMPAILAGALVQPVAAQSFNIDFGSATSTPSDAYGAGSGQSGHWDGIATDGLSTGLVDVTGALTAASVTVQSNGFLANPGVSDVQLLEGDFLFLFAGGRWSVVLSGLSDGPYDLYFYATNSALTPTNSFVANGVPVPGFGPAPRGHMVEGVDYRVLHDVEVTDGTVRLVSSFFGIEGGVGLSGLQLVALASPVPELGGWLLAAAGLVVLRWVAWRRGRTGRGYGFQ